MLAGMIWQLIQALHCLPLIMAGLLIRVLSAQHVLGGQQVAG